MFEIEGIAASPGICIGTVYVHGSHQPKIPKYAIERADLSDELERLTAAVERAVEDIEEIKRVSTADLGGDEHRMLDTHLLMLRDPSLFEDARGRISDQLSNIEWILSEMTQELTAKLSDSPDPYLRERTADIHDVIRRVLGHLLKTDRPNLANLDHEVIVVTHDLLPSDAVAMNKRMVAGIATDAGGKTSHTAIIARSFEIPAVLGLSDVANRVEEGDQIIVDGNAGVVVVDPDEETVQRYRRLEQAWQEHGLQLLGLNELPAETTDGKLIYLNGNIEIPEEVDGLTSHGADGVGLYRSEFLFLQPSELPTEEEQVAAYASVLEAIAPNPVTIRTLDVGGDKVSDTFTTHEEKNPILGWRAIRFCLEERAVFRTQLRALYRASTHGNLRIMFPMISGVHELNRVLEFTAEVREELRREGVDYRRDVPLGIMIEVPSAALISDVLARKVAFFSIGTNDLIQYTVAVDRGNEKTAYLYDPFHPAVLRLIRTVIDNGHGEGLSVAMCGEMAGDPIATLLLLGLGLDEFSMSAAGIPEVKRIIRSTSFLEAEELAGQIMDMRNAADINDALREVARDRLDLVMP